MALLEDLDLPPKPPPGSTPLNDKAWVDYFTALYEWQRKLRAALIAG